MGTTRFRTNTCILGINSAYHEPAACLLRDGEIVAAAEEERFNRIRHGKAADLLNPHFLPEQSIRFCLEQAGIEPKDISHIGYSFLPGERFASNVGVDVDTVAGAAGTAAGEREFYRLLRLVPGRLGEILGVDVGDRFHWLEHHLCHAASAFYASPFEEAAILSVDGIGEATSIWLGQGVGNRMRTVREIRYPNSLGFLWTKVSRFLGFGPYGQWKVMGLGGYGDADRYYEAFRSFVDYDGNGQFTIDPERLQFRTPDCSAFEELFGPEREADDVIDQRHEGIAAALQRITNESLLALTGYLHRETGCRHLCQAGGVALNCIANRVVLEEGPFESSYVQPAANDAGTALGAAYYLWNEVLGQERGPAMSSLYLGPDYADADVADLTSSVPSSVTRCDDIASTVAELLAGGEIVAWFQGRMEFGPRALGNRSILADPRRADTVHRINDQIKHREYFRPFAASVLSEAADAWFTFEKRSASDAHMLLARKVRQEKLGLIPAVTHVDGSCRLQCVDASSNPGFHALIEAFERVTGVPLVLNTSFNDQEPIICSPQDAVSTCRKAGIRFLVIGDKLIEFEQSLQAEAAGSDGPGLGRPTDDKRPGHADWLPSDSAAAHDGASVAVAEGTAVAVEADPQDGTGALDQPVKIAFRSR